MRRLSTAGGRAAKLAVLQRIAGWRVERAQGRAAEAGLLLEQSQAAASDLARQQSALQTWARQADPGPAWPVLRPHVLDAMTDLRSRHVDARAACGEREQVLAAARADVQVVRARQRALDRVAARLMERELAQETSALVRERDDDWLQASIARSFP